MEQLKLPLLTAVIALASAIAGCDSKRELVVIAPDVSGTLTVRGEPAEGAEVLIGFSGNHDHPCAGVSVAAVVDAAGRFSSPEKTARMSGAELAKIPDGIFQNYVCFRFKGELIVGSLLLTKSDEANAYIGRCATPSTSTGYDDRVCRWVRGKPTTHRHSEA